MNFKITKYFIFFMCLLATPSDAQIWPFRKRSNIERATRDLEQRQQQVGQGNAFNPLQPMGARSNQNRIDHLWSAETAYLATKGSGNISLLSASRVHLTPKYELQSHLGPARWVPNIAIKRELTQGTWRWATRHGIYSPTPGLQWAQNNNHHSIIDSTQNTPFILALKNELIASRAFSTETGCSPSVPYLILTAATAIHYGYNFSNDSLQHIDKPIIGSRNAAITGDGLLLIPSVRVDFRLSRRTNAEVGARLFWSPEHKKNSVEQHAALHYFTHHNFAVSPGYILSFGNSINNKITLWPSIDLTWYFGRIQRIRSGLFEQRMF